MSLGAAVYEDYLKKAAARIEQLEAELKTRKPEREDIAIVGLSCRLPGDVHDADSLWSLLRAGKNAICASPDGVYHDGAITRQLATPYAGVIRGIAEFDCDVFGISPREAERMDPLQRLHLVLAWEAFENAGLNPLALEGQRAGVFLGCGPSSYTWRVDGLEALDAFDGTGSSPAVIAGRISYVFGLRGPSMVIDTACSSSLLSVHLACRSLRARECDLALGGGGSLMLNGRESTMYKKANMLSPRGRCRSFDDGADGYVRAEAAGLVVLKRLSDAERDHDDILAVIRGSACNQDGRSVGLTAPSELAQTELIQAALADAKLTAREVSYVEAHGSGTPLGDPIEAQAIDAVFRAERSAETPLLIGSIKGNIGHAEHAAGITGLLKVIVSLQHELLPAQVDFARPNQHIAWDELCVRVNRDARPWPRTTTPRIAGISSFGFSGTNCHLVVSEPPKRSATPSSAPQASLYKLSAQTRAGLLRLAQRHLAFLEGTALSFSRICQTANRGRADFRHRLCFVASSTHELCTQLRTWLAEPQTEPTRRSITLGAVRDARTALAELASLGPRQRALYAQLVACAAEQGIARDAHELQERFDLEFTRKVLVRYLQLDVLEHWGLDAQQLAFEHDSILAALAAARVFNVGEMLRAASLINRPAALQAMCAQAPFQAARKQLVLLGAEPDGELFPGFAALCTRAGVRRAQEPAPARSIVLTSTESKDVHDGVVTELLAQVACAYTAGWSVTWPALTPQPEVTCALPTYCFEAQTFWFDPDGPGPLGDRDGVADVNDILDELL